MAQLSKVQGSGASAAHALAIVGNTSSALTALGSSQGTALLLSNENNEVTTTSASTGVQLPINLIGDAIFVANYGAQTLSVYGQTGESIQSGSANAAFSVAQNKTAMFIKVSSTRWAAILSA